MTNHILCYSSFVKAPEQSHGEPRRDGAPAWGLEGGQIFHILQQQQVIGCYVHTALHFAAIGVQIPNKIKKLLTRRKTVTFLKRFCLVKFLPIKYSHQSNANIQ